MATAPNGGRSSPTPDQVDSARADWRRERPDLDTDPMEVFARLLRVHMLVEARIGEVLEGRTLTLAGFDVLASLRRAGAPYRKTPTELATTSMLTTGGVTFRLDRLEEAGLIQRVRSTEDRRVVYAELTDEGRELIDAAITDHLDNERELLHELTDSESAQLGQLLRKLERSVRSAAPEGAEAVDGAA